MVQDEHDPLFQQRERSKTKEQDQLSPTRGANGGVGFDTNFLLLQQIGNCGIVGEVPIPSRQRSALFRPQHERNDDPVGEELIRGNDLLNLPVLQQQQQEQQQLLTTTIPTTPAATRHDIMIDSEKIVVKTNNKYMIPYK